MAPTPAEMSSPVTLSTPPPTPSPETPPPPYLSEIQPIPGTAFTDDNMGLETKASTATPPASMLTETSSVSLSVNGAYKRYDKGEPFVLKNFCMSVEHNSIYALLGASGCGKTTLLSAIVNKFPLDAGTIHLSISSKRQLGFMPQQIALYEEFSIREMFQYFGILYSMSQREIDRELHKLVAILSLPDPDSLCGSLSGGQQRRVSAAVTMMHSPQLLILDEPTAGIDPLISETIWKHLRNLSNNGVTCLITTHYIEEAKNAHKVGLMRNGIILEENSPENLLTKYKVELLEDVFLRLSEQQHLGSKFEGNNNEVNTVDLYLTKEKSNPDKPLYHEDRRTISKDHIRCQMYKYFNWMKRNILIALFIILLPGVSIECFNLAFKSLPQLSLAVINEDSNCSSPLPLGCANNQTDLSCHYLNSLANEKWHWDLLHQKEPAIAQADLRRNKIHGIITIPKNFSFGMVSRLNLGKLVDDETLETCSIDVELNRGDFIRSHHMEDGLILSYQEFFKTFIAACKLSKRLSRIPPMDFREPIFGNQEPEFIQFISTGLIIQISFCFPVLFSVSSLASEKLLGLTERSLVAGLTFVEVILAHSIMSLGMVLCQGTVAMVSQYWVWAHPFYGSYVLGFALIICEGICGTLLGFSVALYVDSYMPGAIAVCTLNSTILLFCGYLWPIEGMHPWAKPVSYLIPPTTGINALRAIIWKSYPISHPEVMAGFLPPLVWTALFIINMIVYVKRKHV
uniref:ABC transporter G family member 23 n=1 Tax=Cacopsylla melanoneura TaxID=428564 RepID=A0A8D9E423_9HEMI